MIGFYAVVLFGLCFFQSSSSSKCNWSYCVAVIPNRKARAATKSRKAADTPTTTTRASRRKVVVNGSYERPGRTNINAMQWFKTTFLLQCSSLLRPTSTPRHPPPPPASPRVSRRRYITRQRAGNGKDRRCMKRVKQPSCSYQDHISLCILT